MDGEGGIEIAAVAGIPLGQATAADAELLTIFAAGGNAECDRAIERGDAEFRAEHGFPRGDIELVIEVVAFGVEIRMGGVADAQIEISSRSTARAGLALGGDPDAFTIGDAQRDADLEGVRGNFPCAWIGGLEGNGADGTVHDFLEGNEDIALDVAAFSPALRGTVSAGSTEVLLEKIAESGAAEVELLAMSGGASLTSRVGVLPVGTELIIFFPLFRIAKDFVGFVDFFEFRLGGFFVLSDVRMVHPCQFPEGFLDVGSAGVTGHPEGDVVIFEFNGHGFVTYIEPVGSRCLAWPVACRVISNYADSNFAEILLHCRNHLANLPHPKAAWRNGRRARLKIEF